MLDGLKTYIGIAISIIGALAGVFHWNLPDIAGIQDQIVTLVGAGIAIYGRFTTKANLPPSA